jgi:magnesium chelatase family protein
MLYKTLRAAVYGIDANLIQVEVGCSGIQCDQDRFHPVGLPDAAARESRDRRPRRSEELRLRHSAPHITISLAPAVGWKLVRSSRIARDILSYRSMD